MSDVLTIGVHPIFTTTTMISSPSKKLQGKNATGFFFSDNNKDIYLVTNKHVIYGKNYDSTKAQPLIEQIKIKLHTNPEDFTQNEDLLINLFDGKKRLWLEHDRPIADIILIPLNLDRKKYCFHPLNRSYLEPKNIIAYFEKIFVMGYPDGLYDDIYNLPITRIGHLSSSFRVPFKQEAPYMLGDVETHEGMSGSPVFMDLKDYFTLENGRPILQSQKRKFLLVGIYSGQYRFSNLEVRPNLIIIWFPDIFLWIIENNPNRD